MLSENIKTIRKVNGISQEELAQKCNVVRQTVSKWESGLSVPDADMLVTISNALNTSVSTLLGWSNEEEPDEDSKVLAQKLEVINLQLAQMNHNRLKTWFFVFLTVALFIIYVFIMLDSSQNVSWTEMTSDFEIIFMKIAPFFLIGSIIGCVLVKKKM